MCLKLLCSSVCVHLQLPLRLFHIQISVFGEFGAQKNQGTVSGIHVCIGTPRMRLWWQWAGNQNLRWLKEFKILESEEILEQRLNFPAECGMGAHGGLQSVVGKQGRVCSFSCRLKRCILTFICLPQGLAWPLSGFGGVLKRVSKNIPWRWLLLQLIIL